MKDKKLLFIFLFISISFSLFSQEKIESKNQIPIDTIFYLTDEVVTTGTKTTKKIIDIPYPVVRLSNKEYKYDKKTSVNDVIGTVPGVFFQSRYGNHDVRISIRGFGSRSNSGIRGVRILLDGIAESEPDGQTRIEALDFNSIGSIEIVKGNSSSLYTNAPGGVINFINDINFPYSFSTFFNENGTYNLKRIGFKTGVRTDEYALLTTYSYHNYIGYREHSEDYWHILNTVLETTPTKKSKLQYLGYFVSGLIRLPGSLTKQEYDANPFQAAPDELTYDFRRISKKGRIGIRFNSFWGNENNNEFEITAYGTIKYFERTAKDYRIMNRFGLGNSFRFVNKTEILGLNNEFSFGGDVFYQNGPVESYKNIAGKKGDINTGIIDETIANTGFYFQDSYELLKNKLSAYFTVRYDKVIFDNKNFLLESQNDIRRFEAWTPKFALNYKLTPSVAIYSSYGLSFDSPAGNELDNFLYSSNPSTLLNPDLMPQKSNNFEIGIKGNIINKEETFLRNILFEVTFFNSIITDEIVPFEVLTKVYYRNSAKTKRTGIELGGDFEIIKGLKAKIAYTYSDFKYQSYIAQTISFVSSSIVFSEKDFSGNVVPSVPKSNLNFSLSYEKNLSDLLTGFVKTGYQNIGGMFVDDYNTDKTEDYNLVNLTFGIDINYNKLNFLFNFGANNLFNKSYVGFVNINSSNKRFYEAGEPRNYFSSINLGYNF